MPAGWPLRPAGPATIWTPSSSTETRFSGLTIPIHKISILQSSRATAAFTTASTPTGETSTAELAKLLGLPVILCIDATKTTRTMAAVVGGIVAFDPGVRIGGVVLNRVAGKRHQNILTRSIEEYTGIPVVGAVPKLKEQRFPERHMGLVPTPEHSWANPAIDAIRLVAEKHLDLEQIQRLAATARPFESGFALKTGQPEITFNSDRPTIGILRDAAFQFYYPENLEALEAAGARLVFASPLTDRHLPLVDALYIGGGFPETHAPELEANTAFKNELKSLAQNGLPVYAECGGLMYLGERLPAFYRKALLKWPTSCRQYSAFPNGP